MSIPVSGVVVYANTGTGQSSFPASVRDQCLMNSLLTTDEIEPGGIIVGMRVLVQRVTSASVSVDGTVVGVIRPPRQGLLALVGVTHSDDADTAARMAEKLWQLRILDDQQSAADTGAPVLVVSQFTLYANTTKGRRPTWNAAAPGSHAEPLVKVFADRLRALGAEVQTGVFGADMQVESVNDGPVTVMLEI
jgi:D-tyrosyl-tRNA(Tyr) deacylase